MEYNTKRPHAALQAQHSTDSTTLCTPPPQKKTAIFLNERFIELLDNFLARNEMMRKKYLHTFISLFSGAIE